MHMVIYMLLNHQYQSVSNKSYSSLFCSDICRESEIVSVEENHMRSYLAKIYDMPKFI